MKWGLIALAIIAVTLIVIFPVVFVASSAFGDGVDTYWAAISDPETITAIRLTLTVAAIAVAVNLVFGVAAAWALGKFNFWGRSLLLALIDLPLAVSPVISGLVFVLLFGRRGVFGPWLEAHDISIVFALPGMVLATIFVTFPFVARELIPILRERGNTEEEAAVMLGASTWQTLRLVTLPSAIWGLTSGVILCAARAMGEFGAVSVISGHIRGETTTLPLHVEILYNEYQFTAAFAAASLLALVGALTLVVKRLVEAKAGGGHRSRSAIILPGGNSGDYRKAVVTDTAGVVA